MRRFIALIVFLSLFALPFNAHAASGGIPASYFPAGSHIKFAPSLTNADYDATWGAVFHGSPADDAGRVDGSLEFVDTPPFKPYTPGFGFVASTFTDAQNAQASAQEYVQFIEAGGATPLTPPTAPGVTLTIDRYNMGHTRGFFITATFGVYDIESDVLWLHSKHARYSASKLRAQLLAAVQYEVSLLSAQ